jgi:hypothetical protein
MYGWIWRHLPFGLPGRIAGSLLGVAAAGALLWFAVFPAVEPHLWFSDVQVSTPGGGDQVPTPVGTGVTPGVNPSDYVVPYSTASNGTRPSASPTGR